MQTNILEKSPKQQNQTSVAHNNSLDYNPNEAQSSSKQKKLHTQGKSSDDHIHTHSQRNQQQELTPENSGLTLPTIKAYQPFKQDHIKTARVRSERGIEVLNAITLKKQSDIQVQLMENRIKRLHDEEQRALKKIKQTIEKSKWFETVQKERQEDYSNWNAFKDMKQQKAEQLRQQVLKEKEFKMRRLQEQRELDMQIKKARIDELNRSIRQEHEEVSKFIETEISLKHQRFSSFKHSRIQSLQARKDLQSRKEEQVGANYSFKKKNAEETVIQNRNRVQLMEKQEQDMLQKLQNTYKMKDDIVSNYRLMQKASKNVQNVKSNDDQSSTIIHTEEQQNI